MSFTFSASSNVSSLHRLNIALNSSDCINGLSNFPGLVYLNVRKASNQLPPVLPTQTLVLDGNKLAGVTGLPDALSNLNLAAISLAGKSCMWLSVDCTLQNWLVFRRVLEVTPKWSIIESISLNYYSDLIIDSDLVLKKLTVQTKRMQQRYDNNSKKYIMNMKWPFLSAGCQLNDSDIAPMFTAIEKGQLKLHMLKLSANRVGDVSVKAMVDSIIKHKTYPLGLLDISSNKVRHIVFSFSSSITFKPFSYWHILPLTSHLLFLNLSKLSLSPTPFPPLYLFTYFQYLTSPSSFLPLSYFPHPHP